MSTELQKKDRVLWIDLLRIFATCVVPVAHLCSNVWNNTAGETSLDYILLNVIGGATRWAVGPFVLISGIFFLNPNKKADIKKLFSKNIVRMATAFIFWSFLYALQYNLFRPRRIYQEMPSFSKTNFLNDFITGEYHLWYLYMIAFLYMLTPLIKVFTDNASKKQLEAFIVLSFLFANCVPILYEIPMLDRFQLKDIFKENLHLGFVSDYLGLYVGGQYLVRYPLDKLKRRILYVMGIFGYLFTVGMNLYVSFKEQNTVKDFMDIELGNVVIMSYAIFVFFQNVVSKIHFSDKAVKAIKWLSARSFGVYLCHVFVMRGFQYFGIQVIHISPEYATVAVPYGYLHISPIIGVPVLAFFVIVISFLVSWGISKIPVLKKYVV